MAFLVVSIVIVYALLLLDLGFNAAFPRFDLSEAPGKILAFTPSMISVLVFVMFFAIFWNMFPFRMGMLHKVISEFRFALIIWVINLIAQIVSRLSFLPKMQQNHPAYEIWDVDYFYALFIIARLVTPVYYFAIIRATYTSCDSKYYDPVCGLWSLRVHDHYVIG